MAPKFTNVVFGTAFCLLPLLADAEISTTIEAGVGYSDNITRVPTGEIDETIATAGLELNWSERRQRLTADAAVDLDYFDYLDDTYSSELVGTANGNVVVGIVPERLTWLFADSFGQMRGDAFAPVTPENRENVNYFTTGPDLIVKLGQSGLVRLMGRYSSTEYEDTLLDGERYSGGLMVGRRFSASSEVGLNAVRESVDFEDDFNTDYDRDNLFLSYDFDGRRTSLSVEAGYTWLDRDGEEESQGELLQFTVRRQATAASSVWLRAASQFTDSSEALRSTLSGPGSSGATVGITASSDPFERRNIGVGWDLSRNRTSLGLSVQYDEDRYETLADLDRDAVVAFASADRELGRSVSAGVSVSYTDEEFPAAGQTSEELRFGLSLEWQVGRLIGLRLIGERYDRESSDPDGEFVEHRAFLTAFYRPQGSTR